MPEPRRSYGEGCSIAHALDLVGERWALLVVRDLLLGPRRFTDLQAGLPAASPSVLAQRLHDLQQIGVVRQRRLPPPASVKVYELTEWGAELGPVVTGLGLWGSRSQVVPLSGEVRADSRMLTLRTFFEPDPEARWVATYDIGLGTDRYTVRIRNGRLADLARGEAPANADVRIETDPDTFGELLNRRLRVVGAIRSGRMGLTGDKALAQCLFDHVRQ